MCVWFIPCSDVNTNHRCGILVEAGVKLSRLGPVISAKRWLLVALSFLDWTGEWQQVLCWRNFGFSHDSVSHAFFSVCYHGNSFIGMLSTHAVSFATSVLVFSSVPSYALNRTLSLISSVLAKSRAFRPYEGSRCSRSEPIWSFSRSLSSQLPYPTLAFCDVYNEIFWCSETQVLPSVLELDCTNSTSDLPLEH